MNEKEYHRKVDRLYTDFERKRDCLLMQYLEDNPIIHFLTKEEYETGELIDYSEMEITEGR